MERRDRAAVAAFHADEALAPGKQVSLGESETHHVRVRRLGIGDRVRVLNGAGDEGDGVLIRIARRQSVVELDHVRSLPRLPEVHLMLPVADRDRMLLLAEKAAELALSSWRPVQWKRSRSVAPRGEGVTFQGKVRARMIAALTQSGGAWLPVHHPDAPLDRAIAAAPSGGTRVLLDVSGTAFPMQSLSAPVMVAVGPEGGVEPTEREALLAAGFVPVSLGPTTLRFETAAIVALGLTRSALARQEESGG